MASDTIRTEHGGLNRLNLVLIYTAIPNRVSTDMVSPSDGLTYGHPRRCAGASGSLTFV
ncbi:hypothetical protein M430DRAFT_225184 [Amorphotheca resinae ATCC 22711]|uniref:Uncharacterized protein n=1 Tax=Amorphotheca resinae ATCC 22711 TaxID=857342 RepID=A0A2T3B6M1_AMORE|nr:hypothetical protein M430DRAFT_225184 [Amorphotheca resinae ATCC 22711]PSS22404.1 hypothetical protein M430DRAFT_225184 [Amorphotheca resinae ATCC 22711]